MDKVTQKREKVANPASQLADTGTQTTCPVTGEKIDKKIFVDYQGKRVYFCCSACKTTFTKDPEATLKKITDKGERVARIELVTQKTCPVMGAPVDSSLYVDYKGKRIYVCCGGCIAQVKADPEKYLKKLAALGEKPGVAK